MKLTSGGTGSRTAGNGYEFTDTLRPLESFRNDLSILGGLSHPLGRLLVGHATADIWLTGGDVRGSDYRNTISLDQRIAMIQGQETRFPQSCSRATAESATKREPLRFRSTERARQSQRINPVRS